MKYIFLILLIFTLFSCDYKKTRTVVSQEGVIDIKNFMKFNPVEFNLQEIEEVLATNDIVFEENDTGSKLYSHPSKNLELNKNFIVTTLRVVENDGKYSLFMIVGTKGNPCRNYRDIIPKKYINEVNISEYEVLNFFPPPTFEYVLWGYFETKNNHILFNCYSLFGKNPMLLIKVGGKELAPEKKPTPFKKIACHLKKMIDNTNFISSPPPNYKREKEMDDELLVGLVEHNHVYGPKLFLYVDTINESGFRLQLGETNVSNKRISFTSKKKKEIKNLKKQTTISKSININRITGKIQIELVQYFPEFKNFISNGMKNTLLTGDCTKANKEIITKF